MKTYQFRTLRYYLLCLCAAFSGCFVPLAQAIVDATGEDATPPYRFHFVPYISGGSGSCTGTLITPNHVLTAAHCAHEATPSSVSFVGRDSDINSDNTFRVVNCYVHPDFNSRNRDFAKSEFSGTALGDRCGVMRRTGLTLRERDSEFDFAILQLERPVPHPMPPPSADAGLVNTTPVPIVSMPPVAGTPFDAIAVGFGNSTRGVGGTGAGIRRFKDLILNMGTRLIEGSTVAPGDSGGPLFIEHSDHREVIGVASVEGTWALLDREPIRDWIQSRIDINNDDRSDTFCVGGAHGTSPLADVSNDADGDGYLDASEDTCPMTYNPCQTGTDIDGDGIHDDCDACPGDATVALFRGSAAIVDIDDDLDGLPNACDCDPDTPNLRADADHDFIRNSCDNCSSSPNTLQLNADGDPRGDACDVCPDTPDSAIDIDGDGIPIECDNCARTTPNPLQGNCNYDAEIAMWKLMCPIDDSTGEPSCSPSDFLIGDLCDATPCGETRVESEYLRVRDESVQNVVRVDTRAATEHIGRTGFRFCRCSVATSDSAEVRQLCLMEELTDNPDGPSLLIGGCDPLDIDAYDAAEEPRDWRWTTMAFAADPGFPGGTRTPPILNNEESDAYEPVVDEARFQTDLWASWKLREQDVPRWRTSFGEVIPEGPTSRLPGVLWTHTPGPSDGGDATEWERPLASHLWSGRAHINAALVLPNVPPVPCFQYIGPLITGSEFGRFPMPSIGLISPTCLPGTDLMATIRLGPDTFASQPGFNPDWLKLFALPDLRWVTAAEPDGSLPQEGLRYVAVRPKSLSVQFSLVEKAGNLVAISDQQPCAPQQCDPLPLPQAILLSSDADIPEVESLLVLSARRGTLWSILASPDTDTASRLSAMNVDDGHWGNLVERGTILGRVLAATYSPMHDSLWVLDEITHGRQGKGSKEVRLIRIETTVESADASVVARLPRVTSNDSFAMAAGSDGALYVAAAFAKGHHSVIQRLTFDAEGRCQPSGFSIRNDRFMPDGLQASERGLTLVLDDPVVGPLPVGIDVSELQPRGSGVAECH